MQAEEQKRAAGRSILFVCTGNTCRSPLAEGIAKRLIAAKLDCPPSDLAKQGWVIRSAGIAAFAGDASSEEAVQAAAELGFDLRSHRSRPVNPELLCEATDIITMTRRHAMLLQARFPEYGPEPRLLCLDGSDLPDPIGGDLTEYRACAKIIETHLTNTLAEWLGT
jgi:protein-tyrosine-phosphatase